MTVNEQEAVLPDASVAVEFTVVVPTGKTLPDAGTETTVTPGQLSEGVTVKFTSWAAPHNVILEGQVIVGAWVSLTVTVNVQLGPAVEVAVTVVVPTGKNEPDAGDETTVPQSPVVVGGG